MKLLDEKYELGDKIGQGGMGSVYVARNVLTNRKVAIKVVPQPNDELRARFLREARAASALAHPNVVQVYDLGSSPDQIYMVMEFLEGESLGAFLRRKAPLDPQLCIDVASAVLDALDYAHRQGVVHRDIKPENIFLAHTPISLDPVPKLLDFGIARYNQDAESLGLTQSGTVMGTPYYMSPEQLHARGDVDGRADIYALGVILYECMVGKRPYDGDTYASVVMAVMQAAPPEIGNFAPEPLAEVIRIAMARDPADRYPSAARMKAALHRAGAELTTVESREVAAFDGLPAESEQAPPRRRSPVWVWAALAFAVVISVAVLLLSPGSGPVVVPLPKDRGSEEANQRTQPTDPSGSERSGEATSLNSAEARLNNERVVPSERTEPAEESQEAAGAAAVAGLEEDSDVAGATPADEGASATDETVAKDRTDATDETNEMAEEKPSAAEEPERSADATDPSDRQRAAPNRRRAERRTKVDPELPPEEQPPKRSHRSGELSPDDF
ncbi:MAG: protein kinase [Myxococcota bacterium]